MTTFSVKTGEVVQKETDLAPFVVSGGSVGLYKSPDSATFDVLGTAKFSGNVEAQSPSASGHLATKAYVDSVAGTASAGMFIDTTGSSQTKSGSLTISGTTTTETVDLQEAEITAKAGTISVITPVLIDSFSSADKKLAEYSFQISQGTDYSVTKVTVIHNGTDIAITEYGYVSVGATIEYIFDAAYSLGNLEFTMECPTANVTPVGVKFTRMLIDT